MKKKGQIYSENILVALMVLGISIAAISLFGDKLASFFQDQKYPTESSERASIKANPKDINFVSNTLLIDGNKELRTPIETIVRQNMLEKNYIQTAGPQGEIYETALIMKEYLDQLKQFVGKSDDEDDEVGMFLAALKRYERIVNRYLSYNDKILNGDNDPILKLLNELDMSISLDINGDVALELRHALMNLLSTLPDGPLRYLIKLYTRDLLSFGKSLDYRIDSRTSHNVEIKTAEKKSTGDLPLIGTPGMSAPEVGEMLTNMASVFKTAAQNITNEHNEIPNEDDDLIEALAEFLPLQSPDNWADDGDDYWSSGYTKKLNGFLESRSAFNDGSLTLENGMALSIDNSAFGILSGDDDSCAIWVDIDGANIGANQIGTDVFGFVALNDKIVPMGSTDSNISMNSCVPGSNSIFNTGWGCTQSYMNTTPTIDVPALGKEELKQYLQEVAFSSDLNKIEKENIAKQIKMYRNGDLQEIAPSSLNTAQLCGTISANIQNGGCQLRPQPEIVRAQNTQMIKQPVIDIDKVQQPIYQKVKPQVVKQAPVIDQAILPQANEMDDRETKEVDDRQMMPPERLKQVEPMPYTAARPDILKYTEQLPLQQDY